MPVTGTRSRPTSGSGLVSLLPLLAVVALAALVFRGSLAYFFSQDDFAALARARGLAPPYPGLWRWLSGTVYFGLMRPLGLAAVAYHAVNLAAHAACAGILFALLRRRFSAPAALLGALFFGTHAALYTAVYWVSTLNEILALLFALLCIACASCPGRSAWLSVPLFALSLLSKETTLLLPAALWIAPGWLDPRDGHAARRPRLRLLVALSGVALVYLAMWVGSDAFPRAQLRVSGPYTVALGRHVFDNAITYLGWAVGTLFFAMRHFNDAPEPGLWPWAAAAVALWIAGLFSARLRARGWIAGGATFVLLLAPVLGLRNHTYHYYLYASLIGVAWCATALADVWFQAPGAAPQPASRAGSAAAASPGKALAWPVALFIGTLFVLNGLFLVHKIESTPFVDARLRGDPTVDRARIARRVYDGLAAAGLPDRARLLFWSPASMRFERQLHPEADVIHRETYWERNVRAALQEGLAVRVMFPRVDSVAFLHEYRPAEADRRFVLYDIDGTVRVETPARVDSVLRRVVDAR